jgi:hypothetical protein
MWTFRYCNNNFSAKPYDKFMSVIPPEDIWITSEISEDKQDSALVEKQLRKCYLKRMITTYQFYYCRDMIAKLMGEPKLIPAENQLLESSRNLYEPQSRPKIAPPLAGSRKVYGYIRPTRNYTPLTTYQIDYGKTAYKILKGDYKKVPEVPQEPLQGKDIKNHEVTPKEQKEMEPLPCDCYCCSS